MRSLVEIVRSGCRAASGIRAVVMAIAALIPGMRCHADDAMLIWVNGDALNGQLESASDSVLIWRSPLFSEPLQLRLSALRSVKFDLPSESQAANSSLPRAGISAAARAGSPVLEDVGLPDARRDEPSSAPANVSKADDGIPADEFRVLLCSGDVLSGRLTGLKDGRASFESVRFGRFDVHTDDVLSLQRAKNSAGLIYSGPRGIEGWQPAHRRRAGQGNVASPEPAAVPGSEDRSQFRAGWAADGNGRLRSQSPDSAVFLPLRLPDRFQIHVSLESEQTLAFTMAIGRDPRDDLRVATWIDEIVAAQGTRFQPLRRVDPQDRAIHLQLFVDYTAGRMLVYSESGALLGEFRQNGLRSGPQGLLFRNGDFPLSITQLRVSHWSGRDPEVFASDVTLVESVTSGVLTGRLAGFDERTQQLLLDQAGTMIRVPVADVNAVVLPSGPPAPEVESRTVSVKWRDGSLLSGDLLEISAGRLKVRTPFSRQPVTATLEEVDWINLQPDGTSESPIVQPDRLTHAQGSLNGELLITGSSEQPVRWSPAGGLNAVPLQAGDVARIERRGTVQHFSDVEGFREQYPDVIHLAGGDVLPCRIETVTAEVAQFQSPLVELRQVPVTQIRSIELQASDRRRRTGFDDPGWEGVLHRQPMTDSGAPSAGETPRDQPGVDALQRAAGLMRLIPRTTINGGDLRQIRRRESDRTAPGAPAAAPGYDSVTGRMGMSSDRPLWHPDLLTGDTVRFRLRWPRSNGMVMVQLFGSKPRWENNLSGDGVLVTFELGPGSVDVSDRAFGPHNRRGPFGPGGPRKSNSRVETPESEANVTMRVMAGELVVEVNGQVARQLPFDLPAARSRSISIESTLMNGGMVFSNGRWKDTGAGTIELSHFEVDTPPGSSVLQGIRATTLDATLTVPRFRRDNPATHALLSHTGDILRGRLVEVTDSQVVFESRLEPLRLDRSRVAAIVRIDPPASSSGSDTASAPQSSSEPMFALLANGFRVAMSPQRLTDGRMTGESALLGSVAFPAAAICSLYIGQPEGCEDLLREERWQSRAAREPDWDLAQSGSGASGAAAMTGAKAADFELPLLDGQTFRLSEHAGKVVVLDFWATWCGPCVAALPETIAAVKQCDDSQVVLVAVNQQEAADRIREFLAEKRLELTVALDRDGSVAESYAVTGIPHTVVIGPDGAIASVQVGFQPGSGEALRQAIEQLIVDPVK